MTDEDRLALDIATRDYRRPGSRERAARDELGISATQLWQRVNRLLDDPAAALEQPQRVARLRRQRDRLTVQRRAA